MSTGPEISARPGPQIFFSGPARPGINLIQNWYCDLKKLLYLLEMCRKRVFCFRPEAGNEILFFPAPAGAGAGIRGRKSNT